MKHFMAWLAAVVGDVVDFDMNAVTDLIPEDFADLAEDGAKMGMEAKDALTDATELTGAAMDVKEAAGDVKKAAGKKERNKKLKSLRKVYETSIFFPKAASRFEKLSIIMHTLSQYGFDDAQGDL